MRLFLFFILLLSLNACVQKQKHFKDNPFIIEKGAKPWVMAHGGSKALFPENSMMAFEGSMTIGIDALEMDVCMTKDGILVTHHDLTIDRMSNGGGELITFNYEELLDFNFGDGFKALDGTFPFRDSMIEIPTLRSVFQAFPNVAINVEIKNRGEEGKRAAKKLKDLINEFARENNILIASFDESALTYFQEITNSEIPISTSEEETKDYVFTGLSGMEFLYNPDAAVVQLPLESKGISLDYKRMIKSAHRRNMAVHFWTINNKDDMKKLIKRGVDGLITDRPDLMNEVLIEMGF